MNESHNYSVAIPDLATEFDVSEMTIRRDLETLEDQGVARRVYGGAISTVGRSYEPPFASRAVEARAAKQQIAQAATRYVEYGELAQALRDPAVRVSAQAVALCRWLLNEPMSSPLYNPHVPEPELPRVLDLVERGVQY